MSSNLVNRHVKTLKGKGELVFSDQRVLKAGFVIEVSQEFIGNVPGMMSASGHLTLSPADLDIAMDDSMHSPLKLKLSDGQTASIIVMNSNGDFRVTGPIQ